MSPGGIPVPVPVASVPIGGCLAAVGVVSWAVPPAAVGLRGVVIVIGPPAHKYAQYKGGDWGGVCEGFEYCCYLPLCGNVGRPITASFDSQ